MKSLSPQLAVVAKQVFDSNEFKKLSESFAEHKHGQRYKIHSKVSSWLNRLDIMALGQEGEVTSLTTRIGVLSTK